MKVKTLSALAGVGSALILSGTADAAYVGITVVKHTSNVMVGQGAGAPIARDVFRVYALFSDPGDFVTNVNGSPTIGNMIIESRNSTDTGAGGQFANPLGGGATAPYYAYLGSQVQWDTFVDIGLASWGDPSGPPSQSVDETGLSPGFNGLPNSGSLNTDNAAWFTTGGLPQGMAGNGIQIGQNFAVLLMQLTVNTGNHVRGTINVGGINNSAVAGGTTFQQGGQTFNSFPAPGALALIGLAGLAGFSRRRRA